jgi:hypothetical protein
MKSTANPPKEIPSPRESRSQLITLFAWFNIVLCGLSVFACLGMMLLFKTLLPADQMMAVMQSPEIQKIVPASAMFALRHIQAILAASLALSAVMFIASYALLKRRNWARLFWVVMMGLMVVWFMAGLFFQPDISSFLPPELNNAPPEIQAQLRAMIETARISGYALSIVQAVLFVWVIWRFCSQDIRMEFQAD